MAVIAQKLGPILILKSDHQKTSESTRQEQLEILFSVLVEGVASSFCKRLLSGRCQRGFAGMAILQKEEVLETAWRGALVFLISTDSLESGCASCCDLASCLACVFHAMLSRFIAALIVVANIP